MLLFAYLCWTGACLCTRLQLLPGFSFWYFFALASLFATPLFIHNFIFEITESKGFISRTFFAVGTLIILFFTVKGVFLKLPDIVYTSDNKLVFNYHMDAMIIIPCVFILLEVVAMILLVVKYIREKGRSAPWIYPFVLGMAVLFVGNIVSALPNNIFPFDTFSGILNAICLFYALYKKRLFKLKLLVSRGVLVACSFFAVAILFTYLINPIETFILTNFPIFSKNITLIVAFTFAVMTIILFTILQKAVGMIFDKEENRQAQQIRDFSEKASKSLDMNEIMNELVAVVTSVLNVGRAYVCLRDGAKENYRAVCASGPLDPKEIVLSSLNPIPKWFETHNECLILEEFQRTTMYKSLWEAEKRQMEDSRIGCLVPLKDENNLVGILMVAEKARAASYTFDDITFLESIKSIASIALSNASLYEKTLNEARIDHLTGLFNRKYFEEKLKEEFDRCRNSSLALVILNLDDFKLYNQLYGNNEGDIALQKIARIISMAVNGNGIAARYSGKEFALILPGWDTMHAVNLANEIKEKIAQMNKGTDCEIMKLITLSGGVCVYPYAASTMQQLVENADMVVYNAKQNGKNKVLVYSIEPNDALRASEEGVIRSGKYAEYASTIYALTAAIDAKDHITFNHSQKVAEYAAILARVSGLNEEHVNIIYEAALLHDIGKISIPESILTKKGKLTSTEYETMKTHVESSISIIRHLPSMDYVIPSVVGHHERWDGRGYPRGIRGEDIPIGARCLAISDAFDAMTAERSYKEEMAIDFAIAEIERNAGTQFDPQLAAYFIELVKKGLIHTEKPKASTA